MIEILRQMIVSVTAAAIFSTIMLMVVQKSALHEVIRLATGMLMILALLLPLSRASFSHPLDSLAQHSNKMQQNIRQAQEKNATITKSTFGSAISKYIEDTAAQMGVDCTVQTTLTEDNTGTLIIDHIYVQGESITAEQRSSLSTLLERECGIPSEKQEIIEGSKNDR